MESVGFVRLWEAVLLRGAATGLTDARGTLPGVLRKGRERWRQTKCVAASVTPGCRA